MPDSLFAPACRITIDGRPREDLAAGIQSLELRESLDAPASLEVTLVDQPAVGDGAPRLLYADDDSLDAGRAVGLSIGVEDAAGSSLTFTGAITSIDPVFALDGARTLTLRARALARRPPHPAVLADVPTPMSLELGKELAEATLARTAADFITGRGTAIGLPALRPGVTVELSGLGSRFGGRYYVTDTSHRIDHDGYQTRFGARRAFT